VIKIHGIEIDDFTGQYLRTALWSSTVVLPVAFEDLVDGCMDVPEDHPLHSISEDNSFDEHFDVTDFTVKAICKAITDCTKFQEDNADDLLDEDSERAGHDFWLTRNGHGAGFWDGDYEESKGNRLTAACEAYGELHVWTDVWGFLYFE